MVKKEQRLMSYQKEEERRKKNGTESMMSPNKHIRSVNDGGTEALWWPVAS